MRYKDFIQDHFLIDDATSGAFIPFHFNPVQIKYYEILCREYDETDSFRGLREIVLKARKEGFTSLILALFAAQMILSKNAMRFLEISYKDDATLQHYRRAKNFLLSFYEKDYRLWSSRLDRQIFRYVSDGNEVVLRYNQSSFYVGTASARTGERGGTVQGLLFSEPAHYPDTNIIRASEIIEGTRSMVSVGSGMIFQETTANGYNQFKTTWDMAKRGEVDYRPRFFSYKEFYTNDEYAQICRGFTDKSLIPQEFPETEEEAFLSTGRHIFNTHLLHEMQKRLAPAPLWKGELVDNKHTISFDHLPEGRLSIWKPIKDFKNYIISADVAEGISNGAWSVAAVIDRSSWEVVAEFRARLDPGVFGDVLCVMGEYWNWAILIPESNNHGQATIESIRRNKYPHLLETNVLWEDERKRSGFPTDRRTKELIISALRNAIDKQTYIENSPVAIDEMFRAVRDDSGSMVSEGDGYLDTVISRGIGLYCLKFLTLDETYRNEPDTRHSPYKVTSLVSKPKGKAGYR